MSQHAGHSLKDLETGPSDGLVCIILVFVIRVLHHPGFMPEGEQISQNWDDWDD